MLSKGTAWGTSNTGPERISALGGLIRLRHGLEGHFHRLGGIGHLNQHHNKVPYSNQLWFDSSCSPPNGGDRGASTYAGNGSCTVLYPYSGSIVLHAPRGSIEKKNLRLCNIRRLVGERSSPHNASLYYHARRSVAQCHQKEEGRYLLFLILLLALHTIILVTCTKVSKILPGVV